MPATANNWLTNHDILRAITEFNLRKFNRARSRSLVFWRGRDFKSFPDCDPALGPVSRKPRKLIGPAQPVFVICILKTEKHIGPKLCMKGTSVHIKNIMELNSSVIIRLEILLWLSGCENFPGPSRNGPLDSFPRNRFLGRCSPWNWQAAIFLRSGHNYA